jgi:tetratricopeptide (TPR) repeat protein
MQKKSVLNFRQFSGIFEDDEAPAEGVQMKSIDVVMNIFFEIYGVIVTRIGQYKDAVADYQAISNSENDKRGELMVQTINKISDLVVKRTPELKSSMDEYKKSMEFLKQAYDKILAEDKGQLLNIKKKIKDMIISYLDNLVSNVKNTKVPELEKKNESLEYIGDLLLEKDLYQKERIRVIKRLIPLRAKTAELSTKSIFAEMKSAAKSALKKYDDIIKTLQDDSGFEKKKRTERAEEVQNSRFAVISIENELNDTLSKIAIKYGVAKEIDDILKKSLASLSSANTSLEEV